MVTWFVEKAPTLPRSSVSSDLDNSVGSTSSLPPHTDSLNRALHSAAWGRQMETIELYKPENSSLGFSVVGLRSEARGELGIFVQEVQPGGIAAK